MKITAALLALAAASFSGCVVYTDAPSHPPVNAAPTILWADAGCYFDTVLRDEVWYFEADADDPNGVLDVTAVYADVYDSRNGQWIETFELFPTADPYVWYSDWLGSTTRLDCFYDGYEVDIVAYDSFDDDDIFSLYPDTNPRPY